MKRSFTLIEIVFVLIILGILASVGSEIIVKVYENYLLSKSISSTSYKLDVALLQISKRLSNRIYGSEVVRKDDDDSLNTFSIGPSTHYSHIEWLAKAYEVKRGIYNGNFNAPGFSGLADLNASDKNRLKTPGSNLTNAAKIAKAVYGIDLNQSNSGAALAFYTSSRFSPIQAYGWDGTVPNAVYGVKKIDDKTFGFDNNGYKVVSDIYELVCSAYAIDHNYTKKELVLYYNFRPYQGQTYHDGNKTILVNDVTTFKMRKIDKAIEIRLCIEDNTTGTPVEFCGKKVVF